MKGETCAAGSFQKTRVCRARWHRTHTLRSEWLFMSKLVQQAKKDHGFCACGETASWWAGAVHRAGQRSAPEQCSAYYL